MFIQAVILVIGFALLIKSADFLVNGASSLAKKFNVSDLVIGLTVVAFGTSAPEMFVNLFAVFSGDSGIAFGNVVGSNIFNILFILGISAFIFPLSAGTGTVWKEIPFCFLSSVVLWVLCSDFRFSQFTTDLISRGDGLILLSFFAIFIYYTACIACNENDSESEGSSYICSTKKAIFLITGGLLGLMAGGKLCVMSAVAIASALGVSDTLIGLTIVAAGTSMPELATSSVAAYRKNTDIAVGNVVGSNIFNVFFILGISASVRPLKVPQNTEMDLFVNIAASVILFLSMFTGKKRKIDRWEGGLFMAGYVIYTLMVISRG